MTILFYLVLFAGLGQIFGQFEIPLPRRPGSIDQGLSKVTLIGVSNKDWEGPYDHEVLVSGTAILPCIKQPQTELYLRKMYQQTLAGLTQMAILWVHQTWYNVVDPWLGDGRRSYDTLQLNAYWGPKTEPNFNQTALHIADVEQPDNGVYACVVVHYPLEYQIAPVILDKAELLSVHLLRVRSGFVVAPGCEPDQATTLQFCQTGFEKWTFNVYYPVGKYTGDFLFKGQCQSEAFLTALSLGHISPTLWSVGWQFVPYGQVDNSSAIQILTRYNYDLVQPVELCIPDGPRPCQAQQAALTSQQQEFSFTAHNLDQAYSNSRQIWRARWLLLVGSRPQQSGVWQCWIQGIAASDMKIAHRKVIRFLMTEIHVHIIREESSYSWWRSVEVWRFLLLFSAPMTISLIFMLFLVSWISAKLYADLIPHTQDQDLSVQGGFYGKSQRGLEGPFDTERYLKRYLTKSGIEAYHHDMQLLKPKDETVQTKRTRSM